jgi:hypothetical protein
VLEIGQDAIQVFALMPIALASSEIVTPGRSAMISSVRFVRGAGLRRTTRLGRAGGAAGLDPLVFTVPALAGRDERPRAARRRCCDPGKVCVAASSAAKASWRR